MEREENHHPEVITEAHTYVKHESVCRVLPLGPREARRNTASASATIKRDRHITNTPEKASAVLSHPPIITFKSLHPLVSLRWLRLKRPKNDSFTPLAYVFCCRNPQVKVSRVVRDRKVNGGENAFGSEMPRRSIREEEAGGVTT